MGFLRVPADEVELASDGAKLVLKDRDVSSEAGRGESYTRGGWTSRGISRIDPVEDRNLRVGLLMRKGKEERGKRAGRRRRTKVDASKSSVLILLVLVSPSRPHRTLYQGETKLRIVIRCGSWLLQSREKKKQGWGEGVVFGDRKVSVQGVGVGMREWHDERTKRRVS